LAIIVGNGTGAHRIYFKELGWNNAENLDQQPTHSVLQNISHIQKLPGVFYIICMDTAGDNGFWVQTNHAEA
jgi:hypothetical protein